MTAIDVAYCVLIFSGAFALVSLGVFFLKTATTIKQAGEVIERTQKTLDRADNIMDDVNYKLDLLNTPVETVSRFFDPKRPRFNLISSIIGLFKKK